MAAAIIEQWTGTDLQKVTDRLNKSLLGKQRKEQTGNFYSLTEVKRILDNLTNGGSNNTLKDLLELDKKGRIVLKGNVGLRMPIRQLNNDNSFEALGQKVILPKVAAAVLQTLIAEPGRSFSTSEMTAQIKATIGEEISKQATFIGVQHDLVAYVLQYHAGLEFSPLKIEKNNKDAFYSLNTEWYQVVS